MVGVVDGVGVPVALAVGVLVGSGVCVSVGAVVGVLVGVAVAGFITVAVSVGATTVTTTGVGMLTTTSTFVSGCLPNHKRAAMETVDAATTIMAISANRMTGPFGRSGPVGSRSVYSCSTARSSLGR